MPTRGSRFHRTKPSPTRQFKVWKPSRPRVLSQIWNPKLTREIFYGPCAMFLKILWFIISVNTHWQVTSELQPERLGFHFGGAWGFLREAKNPSLGARSAAGVGFGEGFPPPRGNLTEFGQNGYLFSCIWVKIPGIPNQRQNWLKYEIMPYVLIFADCRRKAAEIFLNSMRFYQLRKFCRFYVIFPKSPFYLV